MAQNRKHYYYINLVDIQDIINDYGFPSKIYIIHLIQEGGEEIAIEAYPYSRKYDELLDAAFDGLDSQVYIQPTDLVGRIVIGSLFVNQDNNGNFSYNVDYFELYDNYEFMLNYFSCPTPAWTKEQTQDFCYSVKEYPEYVKDTFKVEIHEFIKLRVRYNLNYSFVINIYDQLYNNNSEDL